MFTKIITNPSSHTHTVFSLFLLSISQPISAIFPGRQRWWRRRTADEQASWLAYWFTCSPCPAIVKPRCHSRWFFYCYFAKKLWKHAAHSELCLRSQREDRPSAPSAVRGRSKHRNCRAFPLHAGERWGGKGGGNRRGYISEIVLAETLFLWLNAAGPVMELRKPGSTGTGQRLFVYLSASLRGVPGALVTWWWWGRGESSGVVEDGGWKWVDMCGCNMTELVEGENLLIVNIGITCW